MTGKYETIGMMGDSKTTQILGVIADELIEGNRLKRIEIDANVSWNKNIELETRREIIAELEAKEK